MNIMMSMSSMSTTDHDVVGRIIHHFLYKLSTKKENGSCFDVIIMNVYLSIYFGLKGIFLKYGIS